MRRSAARQAERPEEGAPGVRGIGVKAPRHKRPHAGVFELAWLRRWRNADGKSRDRKPPSISPRAGRPLQRHNDRAWIGQGSGVPRGCRRPAGATRIRERPEDPSGSLRAGTRAADSRTPGSLSVASRRPPGCLHRPLCPSICVPAKWPYPSRRGVPQVSPIDPARPTRTRSARAWRALRGGRRMCVRQALQRRTAGQPSRFGPNPGPIQAFRR